MNWPPGKGRTCTFAVSDESGRWQVTRDAVVMAEFPSRGDAVRAACLDARTEEAQGRRARVIARPGDELVPHYEPHFGI
jgi:hypothetical protein